MKCFCGLNGISSNTQSKLDCCSFYFKIKIFSIRNFKYAHHYIMLEFEKNTMRYFIETKHGNSNKLVFWEYNQKLDNNMNDSTLLEFDKPNNWIDYKSIVIQCINYLHRVKNLEAFK